MPDVRVEVAFDSGVLTPAADRTWTDVSSYVEFQEEITIVRGRENESATTSPSSCSVTLDNRDGRFTPGLASGAYYPNVKIGRPLRVTTVDVGTFGNHLPVNAAGLEVASSVSDNWEAGGTVPPVLTRSVVRAVSGSASMLITWGTGGTLPLAQTKLNVVSGLIVGRQYTVSAYGYVPTGDPNIFLSMAGQLGTVMSTKNAFTRFSVTFTATAKTHRVQVQPSSAPTASDQAWIDNIQVWEGAAPVTFTTTLAEAAISTRFTGYVDEWPVEWGGVETVAYSKVTASSRLARIGEGAELRSVIEAEILADDPIAYYPLSESGAATHAVDLTGNDRIGMYSYYGGGGIEFGTGIGPATDGLAAARVFPHHEDQPATALAAHFDHALTEVTMECFAVFPRDGDNGDDTPALMSLYRGLDGTDFQFVQISPLPIPDAIHLQSIGGVTASLNAMETFADLDNAIAVIVSLLDGGVHHLALTYLPGVSPVLKFYIDGTLFVTGTTPTGAGTLATTLPTWELLVIGPYRVSSGNTPMTVAHAAVFDTVLSDARIAAHAEAGLTGAIGEAAAERIERYANYAGIEVAEIDSDPGVVPLAHIDTTDKTVESLLRIVEATENGILYDGRDGKLVFRDRDHRYNVASAFTLDVDAQEVEAEGLRPVLDRSLLTNSVSARAADGSVEQRFDDATSIEDYGPKRVDLELATADSDQLYQLAAWKVSKYKEPSPRIASLAPVDALTLGAAERAGVVAADISTRFTVENLPSQAPATDIDFFVEGITETLALESWRFQFNVSPADLYDDIWILGDANKSQLGSTTILAL